MNVKEWNCQTLGQFKPYITLVKLKLPKISEKLIKNDMVLSFIRNNVLKQCKKFQS